MAISLSYLFCNLPEGIQKLKYKACDYFIDYKCVKNNLIKYLPCNKGKLKKKIKSTFKFYDNVLIDLFWCQKKVLILMNMCMIGKSLMKQHYLKKKNFIIT